MRSAALQPAQQGSTSQPQRQVHRQAHAHSSRRQRRREGAARLQAVKEDCRDKVNSPQHTSVSERTVKVTFQGAGGQAVEIDCPEVRPLYTCGTHIPAAAAASTDSLS